MSMFSYSIQSRRHLARESLSAQRFGRLHDMALSRNTAQSGYLDPVHLQREKFNQYFYGFSQHYSYWHPRLLRVRKHPFLLGHGLHVCALVRAHLWPLRLPIRELQQDGYSRSEQVIHLGTAHHLLHPIRRAHGLVRRSIRQREHTDQTSSLRLYTRHVYFSVSNVIVFIFTLYPNK